jgi:hypothetical protein
MSIVRISMAVVTSPIHRLALVLALVGSLLAVTASAPCQTWQEKVQAAAQKAREKLAPVEERAKKAAENAQENCGPRHRTIGPATESCNG